MRSTKYISKQFLSLGFIKNQCSDEYMVEMSRTDKVDGFQRGRGGREEGMSYEGLEVFFTIILLVLVLTTLGFCTYFILKRRGQLCKRRDNRGLRAVSRFDSTEFNNVSQNSTAKKIRNRKGELDIVPQDSYIDDTVVTNNAIGIDDRTISRI